MTDVAYSVLDERNEAVPFADLWGEVCARLGFNESQKMKKISQFYTNLSLDDRFATSKDKDNVWDLKKRMKFEETFVDVSELEIDESEMEDEFDEESEEEADGENTNNPEEY
ncbi:MAG: DNA-directed RNA polymerase subunit delta [Erysipelotrichaceae bacterium]|nr:DNA-directed RNA polymerase subunit delta [Erysipelotrichaceae bacterium]